MSLSTWNDKNQHWLSQFLLKGSSKKGDSSLVYQRDCATGVIATRRVEDVASKAKLMTEQDDGVLRDIESRASTTVRKVRKRHLAGFGEADRDNLDKLVMALVFNHPSFEVEKERIRTEDVNERHQFLSRTFENFGGRFDSQDMFAKLDGYASRNYLLELKRHSRNSQTRHLLRSMGLTVHAPPQGESFVIGDYPVVQFTSDDVGHRRLPHQGLRVMLPIGHSRLLVYDSSLPRNIIDEGPPVSMGVLRSLDEIYLTDPRCRYIYGRTSESLTRSSNLHLAWHDGPRLQTVNPRWLSIQSETEELEKSETERKEAREFVMRLAIRALAKRAT